jgi:hypothetical protein
MSNSVGYAWLGLLVGGPIGLGIGVAAANNEDRAAQAQAAAHNREIEQQKAKERLRAQTQEHLSDNDSEIALAMVGQQQFAISQAALDRDLQRAASLELSLEKFDTNLQVSKMNYIQEMTAEENRHIEKMAQSGRALQHIQNTYSLGADLPPPEEDR